MIALDSTPQAAEELYRTRPRRPALEVLRSAMPGPLSLRVTSARELARERAQEEREPLATAHPALDALLPGGLPRGEMVEVTGGRSSGRLSLALAALAAATATGEAAALVDLGDHLDPAAAAAAGIDLARLLWVRPPKMKQALAAAEMAITGGFPLVVVELGTPPLPGGRGLPAGWLRLARAARERGTALFVSSPYRVSGTAAAAVLAARRGRTRWEGEGAGTLLGGLSSRLIVEKRRGALPGEARSFALAVSTLPGAAGAAPAIPDETVRRKSAAAEPAIDTSHEIERAARRRAG